MHSPVGTRDTREVRSQTLRKRIKEAKDAGATGEASEAIQEIRSERLWKELGFTSFNDYAKSDACPYSSNYAYKMSATDPLLTEPGPNAFVAEDRTNQSPGCVIEGPVTDLTPSELEAGKEGLLELVQNPDMREVLSAPGVTDLRGNELHGDLAELFIHAGIHFDILEEAIHKMRDTLRDLVGVRSGARFSVHSRSAGLMKHLHDIEAIVHDSRPYSVCISCSGNRRQCIACGGVGFITKSQYEDATTRRRR